MTDSRVPRPDLVPTSSRDALTHPLLTSSLVPPLQGDEDEVRVRASETDSNRVDLVPALVVPTGRRRPRAVVLADVKHRVVALHAIDNGSGFLCCDVRALALAAGLEPRFTSSTCWIGVSDLPDFEALAEYRGVVVQRTGRSL